MESQIPQNSNAQNDTNNHQNTQQHDNKPQTIAQFGEHEQQQSPHNQDNTHRNFNQFQNPQSPANANNFSYNNFIQSKNQQEAHYENQEDYLKHFQSDFRYHIMNVFYQLVKNSLYIIIFASTARYAFQNFEKEGCYYVGPETTKNYELHTLIQDDQYQYINHFAAKTQNAGAASTTKPNYTMEGHMNGQSLIAMAFNTNIGLIFLNLISLVYLYVQDKFVKLEFYIIYGLNFTISTLILVFAFYDQSKNTYTCYSAQMFFHAFLYVTIKKEIEIGYIICKQISDTTTRQINLCSNCVFVYLLMASPNQAHCTDNAQTLTFSIEVTNILALVFFTTLNFGYKSCNLNEDTRRALKFITILLCAAFFMVYSMVLYNFNNDSISLEDDTCLPLRFVLRNYQFIVPVSMFGMIFVFHSLNKNFDEEFDLNMEGNQLTLKNEEEQQQNPENQNQQQNNLSPINQNQNQNQQQLQQLGYQNSFPNQQQQQQQIPIQQQGSLDSNFQNQNQFNQSAFQQQNQQQAFSPNNFQNQQNQFQNQGNLQNSNIQNNQNLKTSPFKLQDQAPVTLEGLRRSYQSQGMLNQSPYNNSQQNMYYSNHYNDPQQQQFQQQQQFSNFQPQYGQQGQYQPFQNQY